MNVAIVEPEADGHHLALYVRHVAREMRRRGWTVRLVTTREAIDHAAFRLVAPEFRGDPPPLLMPRVRYPSRLSTAALVCYQFAQWRAFARAWRRWPGGERPDVVYVSNLDYIDKAMAVLGSPFGDTPVVGMLMSVRHHHRAGGVIGPGTRHDRLYEALFRRLVGIRTLAGLLAIDEPLIEQLRAAPFAGSEKVHFVPDVAALATGMSKATARASLGLHDDRQLLLLAYGSLSERKGVAPLIEAVASRTCPPEVAVLLAGGQDDFTRAVLASPAARALRIAGRLYERVGFLDDQDESLVHAAADLAWAGYLRFYGMSGVLLQAAAGGLPVIGSREGLVGWLIRQHGLGVDVDVTDAGDVAAGIARLAGDPSARAAAAARGRELARRHTPEAFGAAICDVVAAAGRRAEADVVSGAPLDRRRLPAL